MSTLDQLCKTYAEVQSIQPSLSRFILGAIKRASRGQADSPFRGRLTTPRQILKWLRAPAPLGAEGDGAPHLVHVLQGHLRWVLVPFLAAALSGCVASSEVGARFTPPPRFEGFASRVEALQAAWAHAGRLGLNTHTVQIINGKTGSMRPHYTADHYVVLRLSNDLLAARGHYVVRKLPLSMGGGRAAHAAGVLTGSGLVTYGTANPRNDPFCRAEDLVGVVVATYHWAPRKGRP